MFSIAAEARNTLHKNYVEEPIFNGELLVTKRTKRAVLLSRIELCIYLAKYVTVSDQS